MLKQILLAATALTIVAGTTALTRAADADADAANRVATELNTAIAKATPPGADNRSIVVEGDPAATNANGAATTAIPTVSANTGDLPAGANVIVNPGPAGAQIVPGAEVAAPATGQANQTVPGAEVAAPATGQANQTVPGAEVAPANGQANAGQPATGPATTTGPAVTATPGGQQALAPVHDGADLYQRLLVQGYRVVKLLQSDGSVFTVLADDIYRTDIGYVLAVDTTYGKIISLRTVSLSTYGYGYGTYTAPATTPTYGNTYGNGYGTYTAPAPAPTYNNGYTTYSYGNTYAAPSTNTYGGYTGTYAAPQTYAPSYAPHY